MKGPIQKLRRRNKQSGRNKESETCSTSSSIVGATSTDINDSIYSITSSASVSVINRSNAFLRENDEDQYGYDNSSTDGKMLTLDKQEDFHQYLLLPRDDTKVASEDTKEGTRPTMLGNIGAIASPDVSTVEAIMLDATTTNIKTATKSWRPWEKFLTRLVAGSTLLGIFCYLLYRGHVYVCAFVSILQILLFRELVTVRYNAYFHIIEQNIPLFRTTQWMWFFLAIFYTYSDFALDIVMNNTSLHFLKPYAQLQGPFSFLLYTGTFILTITTMKIGYIRFQINQLCWTILVLCLIVGQVKYIMHNVYNGLIWFALPIFLVITNDVAAYFSGMTCGRKFIHRPFVHLSPNKTWEGFIGATIVTVIVSWYLSKAMASFPWLICPTNHISFLPTKLDCELDPVFHAHDYSFPSQIFEVLPIFIVKLIPGIVDMCSYSSMEGTNITACISGEATHIHHHFEFIARGVYPIQIHAVVLGMFASLVAPFGGYLASGIKRAYAIKDFDSIIPGHGGVMDRMDCQLIMALYTWVHYNTFVRITTVSVPKMLYMFNLMKESEQQQFYAQISAKMAYKGP